VSWQFLIFFLVVCCVQQEGHGKDWIYTDGPDSGPLKGARSHYYNEFKWDSDRKTGGDFAAGSNVPEEDLINENFVANERASPPTSPFICYALSIPRAQQHMHATKARTAIYARTYLHLRVDLRTLYDSGHVCIFAFAYQHWRLT